jgi:hypothetical protein
MARSTIARGAEEIEQKAEMETGRARKPGGGHKPKQVADSNLLTDLKLLVEQAKKNR